VFKVDPEKGLILTEIAEGETVEDIIQNTGCDFNVSFMSAYVYIPLHIQVVHSVKSWVTKTQLVQHPLLSPS